MASPISTSATTTTSAAISGVTKTTSSSSSSSSSYFPHCTSRVSFRLSPRRPKLRFFSKSLQPSRNFYAVVKAQLNKVAVNASNASALYAKSEEPEIEEVKDSESSKEPSPDALATEESISEFISQVSTLLKLVDSRDIVELHLKQLDCELVIRKKEALPQPQSPAQIVMMQPPSQPSLMSPAPAPAPAPASSLASSLSPSPSPSPSPSSPPPPPAPSAKSSLPTLKCPMAGTFYRSSGPGEPPYVKVGDKVQKGQILCIIEAMKLMNEIEADQSGKIVDILVEDGKPVSVDMPLFVIQP